MDNNQIVLRPVSNRVPCTLLVLKYPSPAAMFRLVDVSVLDPTRCVVLLGPRVFVESHLAASLTDDLLPLHDDMMVLCPTVVLIR